MAHRPYPNRDRALRQLNRHDPRRGLILAPPEFAPLAEAITQMRRNARQAAAAQPHWSGEYRLSTR